MVGLKQPVEFKGHSMLNTNRPLLPFVITEYMGPGCPDMMTKRMWLSIRDGNFLIGYKVGIFEAFEDGELSEVYDLKADPNSFYNINYKIKKERIDYLLIPLKERFEEIKKDSLSFLQDLRDGRIKELS